MTFALFAGRFSTRRLHQIVQRNVNLRHAHDNSSPKKAMKNSRYSTWMNPIKVPFRAYSSMQVRSPYITQLSTSLVIYFLGDLTAQTFQTTRFTTSPYEPVRGLRAMLIGGLSSIPTYHWFLWLGRNFNYAASPWRSLGVKVVVNQMCFTPVFNCYFFGMQTFLAGGGWREVRERCERAVPRSWVGSWKVWPVVTGGCFRFVRPESRNAVLQCFAVGWQGYLGWLNRRAEEDGVRQREREVMEGKV